jgi:uncharacterized phage infection (PIP) family protein YhgE
MNFLIDHWNRVKTRAIALCVSLIAFGLILFPVSGAIALPGKIANPVKAEPTAEKTEIVLPKAIEDARLFYERTVQKTNSVIDGLAAQFASPNPDEDAIEDGQDDLENAADNLDDLAEKVGKFSKKLLKSGDATANEALQKNLQALQKDLNNSAEIVDILADDTERAKEGASEFLKNRIAGGIDAAKQSLQESDRALEDLISTVKAQLQKAV